MTGSRQRVLVVDDEPSVQVLLRHVLAEHDLDVVVAATVADGVAHLAVGGLHAALIDKNLPDGSGLDLIRRMKSAAAGIPAILITAYASLDSAIEALQAGAVDYLLKPFDDVYAVGLRVRSAIERATLAAGLADAEARYRQIFEASSDAILLTDADRDVVVDANQSAAYLFARTREALVGAQRSSLEPRIDASGSPVATETSSGSFRTGGRTLAVHVIRDLSERTQADLALRGIEERLRRSQRVESLGRMAGGVTHDFNNVLTVILNNASVALEELALIAGIPSEVKEDLTEVVAAARSGARITRQLLSFSRGEVAPSKVFELDEAVCEMERLLARSAGAAVLRVRTGAPEVRVKMPLAHIEQLLVNLVINARDAVEAALQPPERRGGTIEVSTQRGEGRVAILRVSDDGAGMSQEVQERIFEPFFTTKGPSKGTGLGLATVQGIVEAAGGTIAVRSSPREGTTFEIRLPTTEEAMVRPTLPVPATGARKLRVLLVEDNLGVRRVIRRMLERAGHHVVEAESAPAALAAEGIIDLVVCDVLLEVGNGADLCAELRRRRPGLPVLFISAHPSDARVQQRVLATAERFLAKPFEEKQLLAAIREALGQA